MLFCRKDFCGTCIRYSPCYKKTLSVDMHSRYLKSLCSYVLCREQADTQLLLNADTKIAFYSHREHRLSFGLARKLPEKADIFPIV
jgi:hypothetical protein